MPNANSLNAKCQMLNAKCQMKFKMEKDMYEHLVDYYFKQNYNSREIAASICKETGIWRGVRTVQRCLRKCGLRKKTDESPIEEIVSAVQSELCNIGRCLGANQIWRRLRVEYGLLAKRSTVRDIIKIIEPERAAAMKKGNLQRRQYLVRGPNHMWHVDGNDKLKPYGMCISGAIDGWSRKIIWLDVDETNKDPRLICTYFLNTVKEHKKVPMIVRMDRGTENVGIANVQTLLRSHHDDGFVRCSVMYGSSNHNQRIERYWHYLRQVLLQSYMDLFKDLELSGVLQMDNIIHAECLKFCFMSVIRNELQEHLSHWNKHRVRQMKNVRSLTGIPNFMYSNPEFYDCEEQGQLVDELEVEHCLEIHYYRRNQYGCHNDFAEWGLSLMQRRGWCLPVNQMEAFDLFSNMIMVIYEED